MSIEHESRAARLNRYANDRRFTQIVTAFVRLGVRTFIYATDERGLMHRLDPAVGGAICGAPIPQDAKIEFYKHATCVRCACSCAP